MDKEQLTYLIIIPLLKKIPHGYSKKAVTAIQMIIAHESQRGKYIRQLYHGPAMGLIMMEPPTYQTVWKYGESCFVNACDTGIITGKQYTKMTVPPIERLLYDIRFNIFMARQRLFMKPEALPETPAEISIYLKKHWNSPSGAAEEMSYLRDWLLWS